MYYKIENKDSEVYKQLFYLRTNEREMEEENRKLVQEKVGLHFDNFLGHHGQQNVMRMTQYQGFCFTEHEKVNMKVWNKKTEKDGTIVYLPNRKTKDGKEMAEFLLNGLKKSFFQNVFDILKIERGSRFTFPYVEIIGELILVYIDDKSSDILDESLIEITRKEFESLLQPYLSKPLS